MNNKTQITKEKLNLFVICGKHYINTNLHKKSILWINVNEILPIAIKKLKKVEREKDLIKMQFCKKSASKHIEYDKKGNYQFTEEDNKKVLAEFDRIDEELVEIPTLIVPKGEYPQHGLTYDMRQGFLGIVLPEDEYRVDDPDLVKMLDEENKRVSDEIAANALTDEEDTKE